LATQRLIEIRCFIYFSLSNLPFDRRYLSFVIRLPPWRRYPDLPRGNSCPRRWYLFLARGTTGRGRRPAAQRDGVLPHGVIRGRVRPPQRAEIISVHQVFKAVARKQRGLDRRHARVEAGRRASVCQRHRRGRRAYPNHRKAADLPRLERRAALDLRAAGNRDRKHRAVGGDGGLRGHPPFESVPARFVQGDDPGRIVVGNIAGRGKRGVEYHIIPGPNGAGT